MNARRLRGDATADEVAKAAREEGLSWGTGRISDLEHGRVSPTLGTLVALAAALGDVNRRPCTLAELVEHDGLIELTKELLLSGEALQRFLGGAPVVLLAGDGPHLGVEPDVEAIREGFRSFSKLLRALKVPPRLVFDVQRQSGETEDRVAKALGVDPLDVCIASAHLWKTTLSAERDRRAGPDASPQARGRITRILREEIKAALDGES